MNNKVNDGYSSESMSTVLSRMIIQFCTVGDFIVDAKFKA